MNKTTEKEFLFCEYCTRTNPVSHFMIVPTIEVFRMSLYKWGGFSNNKVFVGLDNFKILWNDMNFSISPKQYCIDCYRYTYHHGAGDLVCHFVNERKDKREEFIPNYFLHP